MSASDVTNTGSTAGATVAQLYALHPVQRSRRGNCRRSGWRVFQRTADLQPGQTQSITLDVHMPDLSLWDESQLKQAVYDGPYQFGVGANSADISGSGTVNVTGASTPQVKYVTVQPDQVVFKPRRQRST